MVWIVLLSPIPTAGPYSKEEDDDEESEAEELRQLLLQAEMAPEQQCFPIFCLKALLNGEYAMVLDSE